MSLRFLILWPVKYKCHLRHLFKTVIYSYIHYLTLLLCPNSYVPKHWLYSSIILCFTFASFPLYSALINHSLYLLALFIWTFPLQRTSRNVLIHACLMHSNHTAQPLCHSNLSLVIFLNFLSASTLCFLTCLVFQGEVVTLMPDPQTNIMGAASHLAPSLFLSSLIDPVRSVHSHYPSFPGDQGMQTSLSH